MNPPAANPRFHSLDALRAFALLLGIFFHAAESFCPGRWTWAIVDRYPHAVFDFFQHTCHSFRLELFFLIAGFFAHLVYARRGLGGFVRQRVQRILIPLVVGWFVVYPIIAYEWIYGALQSGQSAVVKIPAEVQHLAPWQLLLGSVVTGKAFGDNFSLTHLWFLYQLLVVYAVVLGARAVVSWIDRGGGLRRRLVRLFPLTLRPPWNVAFYAAATTPILWGMAGWGVDTPDRSLLPSLPATAFYALIFTVGWLLYRTPELIESWPTTWGRYLLAGIALAFATASYRTLSHWLRLGTVGESGSKLIYSALYATMMWTFIVGFVGLFAQRCRAESGWWRYVADSSYWLYIAHAPLVVALQLIVAPWDVHWLWKYLLIVGVAFPVLFASYHFLVRSTFIGAQLNGRRYPFRLRPDRGPRVPGGGG